MFISDRIWYLRDASTRDFHLKLTYFHFKLTSRRRTALHHAFQLAIIVHR